MNNLKKILVLGSILLLVGCTTKVINKAYEKMEVGTKGINGYILDLRIYGTNEGTKVSEIIKITNYNNKEYKIVKTLVGATVAETTEETSYIKDNKNYIKDANGIVVETTKEIEYSDPSIYLEGLKNIKKNGKAKTETIGENKYTYYEVTFKKDIVNKILDKTSLKEMNVTSNVEGTVYIDSKGYVYRIIYKLDSITINANYYSIDTVRSINMTSDILNR